MTSNKSAPVQQLDNFPGLKDRYPKATETRPEPEPDLDAELSAIMGGPPPWDPEEVRRQIDRLRREAAEAFQEADSLQRWGQATKRTRE